MLPSVKTFYLTLDFEEDLGSATRDNTYFSHQGTADFISAIKENGWKVTLFVTGEILAERPELLAPYEAEPDHFSFGLHSYNHAAVFGSPAERLGNLEQGLRAYEAYFGHAPRLYRAPNGMISRPELELLAEAGVPAGSNFFPAFFPGRFNHLHVPRDPFRLAETDFLEIPFSVTRWLRVPIALSYYQLLGRPFLNLLLLQERPNQLVFDFHLHDLYPEYWYDRLPLSRGMRLAYARAARPGYARRCFQALTRDFARRGYQFGDLHDLANTLQQQPLPQLSLDTLFP